MPSVTENIIILYNILFCLKIQDKSREITASDASNSKSLLHLDGQTDLYEYGEVMAGTHYNLPGTSSGMSS